MNKNLFSLVVLAWLVVICASCRVNVIKGEGKKVTKSQEVTSFSAIEIDIPVTATINVDENAATLVQFYGYENLLTHIKTKIENDKLHIYTDLNETWTFGIDEPTNATINIKAINSLEMSGASVALIHGNVKGGNFKIDLSGACKVIVDSLNVKEFLSEASGAATIEVKGGIVQHTRYEISGAGKIIAFPLVANDVELSISGAGKGQVTAMQKLDVSISGAGSIKYKGHPVIKEDISGAGTVSDAN